MLRAGVDSVEFGLKLGVMSISGIWKPSDDERSAAWELYVELATRVAAVPPSAGLLREALSSLNSLFATTRGILRIYGPAVARPRPEGEYNFGQLAILVLNYELRPLLDNWHPALEHWESLRPIAMSPAAHEAAWEHADRLRRDIEQTSQRLVAYTDLLADAAGVPRWTPSATTRASG
jgi:hypothetical protein